MWGPDEGTNDLDRYFKVIESEARDLKSCNPQSGTKPGFNKNRNSDSNYSGGGGGYNSQSRYNDNSGDNYGGNSGGYGGGYGGSSGGYGSSNNRPNNSNNYGSNSYGASNSYGGNSSGYGGGSNYGGNSNGYGSRDSKPAPEADNTIYYGNAAATRPSGNDSNSYGGGSTANYGANSSNNYGSNSTNGYGGASSNYGGASNGYGSNNPDSTSKNYGAANGYSDNAYNSKPDYGSSNNNASSNIDDWGAAPSNDALINKTAYNNTHEDQNRQQQPPQQSHDAPRSQPASNVSEDVDGYQRLDFNRCLISYNEPTSLNIRHIFLNVLNRSDLMDYTAKIMECANQDKIVLAIQRDNQLAESYAAQLRARGYYAFEVTNKTLEPEKLIQQHSVYRCAVTTMSYLRDNVDAFQFPSIIINFDHVVSHVKFLERFLNYRNPNGADARDCYIYEMCFNHSTTSQNLREFIQGQASQ